MSGPQVVPVEGLGETVQNVLGQMSKTLQAAAEMRQQQQQQALRELVAGAQLQQAQAETEHTQTQTAGDRAKQAEDVRRQREEQRINAETQRALGPVLLQIGAGRRVGDSDYEQAWAQTLGATRDPQVVAALLHHRDTLNTVFQGEAKARSETAAADVAQANAPNQVATAQATTQLLADPVQRRLAAMHNAGTLTVYLQRQSENFQLQLQALKDRNDERSRNAQADLFRRQLVVSALKDATTAYAADPHRDKPPIERYMNNYLTAYAHQIIDPTTGGPMDPDVLRGLAGQLIRRSPGAPAPSGQPAPATRSTNLDPHTGESRADYWERLRAAGLAPDAATRMVNRKLR